MLKDSKQIKKLSMLLSKIAYFITSCTKIMLVLFSDITKKPIEAHQSQFNIAWENRKKQFWRIMLMLMFLFQMVS